jgi:hypothetical protein
VNYFLRTAAINIELENSLSRQRLDKYLVAAGGDLDMALAQYERNTRLSESFYTPLQCMEICLRNTLDRELKTVYGADWFQNGRPPFERDAVAKILEIVTDISRTNKPITAGAIVAELSFGFWVSILGPRYDATLWRQALYKGFREHGTRMKRDRVHRRFNALRRFRNRIAHHEPIFLNNLQNTHSEIIEATSWMCAYTAAWTLHHSRFATVFAAP